MAIWDAQSIQFVWFVASIDGMRADAIFEDLMGEAPESVQRNKTPGPANPFFSVASGRVAELHSQVQIQPGRIDLILARFTDPNDEAQEPFPLLSTQDEILRILQAMRLSKATWAPSVRLSVIANLMDPAADQVKAYEVFASMTGVDPGVPDITDAMLQLNRRKDMIKHSGSMNRILRYSTVSFQQFLFQINAGGGPAGTATPILNEKHAASLTLDVNTVPDGRIIEPGNQIAIFEELAEELLRLAADGTPKALVG